MSNSFWFGRSRSPTQLPARGTTRHNTNSLRSDVPYQDEQQCSAAEVYLKDQPDVAAEASNENLILFRKRPAAPATAPTSHKAAGSKASPQSASVHQKMAAAACTRPARAFDFLRLLFVCNWACSALRASCHLQWSPRHIHFGCQGRFGFARILTYTFLLLLALGDQHMGHASPIMFRTHIFMLCGEFRPISSRFNFLPKF